MTEANQGTAFEKQAGKPPHRGGKARLSIFEKLSSEELRSLRLDDGARMEFDARVQRFHDSRAELEMFDGEDVASMGEVRYDQLSASEAQLSSDALAIVHFMAPRILRLRNGAAKRKWRSFLTKFRKDEKLT